VPAALAALHQYRDTRRRRWLAVFALALVVQGLCSSYYLLFFSVLLGLWLLWFLRRDDAASLLGVLLAGACALAALIPLAWLTGRANVMGAFRNRVGVSAIVWALVCLIVALNVFLLAGMVGG